MRRRLGGLSPCGSWVAVLVCVGLAAPGRAEEKLRPMTVDDVMKVRYITDVALSPDGERIAYVISEADLKQGRYNTDVWLLPFAGGTPTRLTNSPGQDDSPRWSPDGKTLAFLSDRAGKPQIWLIPVDGGEARQLTDSKTGVRDHAWSPGGKRLAYIALEPDTEAQEKQKRDRTDVRIVGQNDRRDHLHLVTVADGLTRQLVGGKENIFHFAWSPDGTEIAYSTAPTRRVEDQFNTDLYVLSVGTGKGTEGARGRPLVRRDGLDTQPRWSPDGRLIAFVSGDGRRDWIGNTYLCVVSAAGGAPRNVSRDYDGVISAAMPDVFAWSPDGKGLYFVSDEKASRPLFAASLAQNTVKPVSAGPRLHTHFSVGRGGRVAFLVEDPATPREVYVGELHGDQLHRPKRLTTTNPQLKQLALGQVEAMRWKSFDGLEIEGLLIRPVGYRKGTRYPLLTYIHGGPALQFAHGFSVYPQGPPQASRYPIHVLAGAGYAIFCPNPRGSTGYGEKFRKANRRDWGGGDFRDVMTGVDELIERGLADPKRLGIMGWSYGGYMTSWAITQTDRFKAASAGAGVTNLISMYGQTDIPALLEEYFDGLPWNQRELYAKHSAMTYAGRIKTPTLIQHGEKDDRVPLAQSQELYAALKRIGVPVEFAIYPRQAHNPSEPRLQVDVLRRNVDWFNRWLKKH